MSYGPAPWVQRHWDLRAAANFVFGGIGSGVIVFASLAGARGTPAALALVAGLALVGAGLFSVWLEIGRPVRAIRVFTNPRTSWMSREAYVAIALAAMALVAAWMHRAEAPAATVAGALAALVALAFVYCQGRMLNAAKGIPAWRSPATAGLIVTTSLAEGAGAWWLVAAAHAQGTRGALALLGVLLVARLLAWLAYRRTIAGAPRAAAALAPAGWALAVAGTLAPLVLLAVAATMSVEAWVLGLSAAAGALALAGGAWFKIALILRGAYNQGFAVPHMPVRGART